MKRVPVILIVLLLGVCLLLVAWARQCAKDSAYRYGVLQRVAAIWYEPVAVADVKAYGDSLIRDGDFEDTAPSAWLGVTQGEGRRVEDAVGRADSRALRVEASDKDPASIVQEMFFKKPPSFVYVSGWIRTEELQGRGAAILLLMDRPFNLTDDPLEDDYGGPMWSTPSVVGSTGWTHVEVAGPVYPETKRIRVLCSVFGSQGRAFFDDVGVYAAYRPPILDDTPAIDAGHDGFE